MAEEGCCDLGFRVLDLGFRFCRTGFTIEGSGFRIQDVRLKASLNESAWEFKTSKP